MDHITKARVQRQLVLPYSQQICCQQSSSVEMLRARTMSAHLSQSTPKCSYGQELPAGLSWASSDPIDDAVMAAQAPLCVPSHCHLHQYKTSNLKPSVKHLLFTACMPPAMKYKKKWPKSWIRIRKNIWSLWQSLSSWPCTRSRDHLISIPLTASNFFQADDF